MTFEEWFVSEGFKERGTLTETFCKQAYTAALESMRPLVEKMREALMRLEGDTEQLRFRDDAIAEADKFLGGK